MNDERFFTRLAEKTDAVSGAIDRAPARLKSRLYSALVAAQAAAGRLRSLPATKAAGHPWCVCAHVLHVVRNECIVSMNACRVYHARVLTEHFESPPFYWPHCPYVDFERR